MPPAAGSHGASSGRPGLPSGTAVPLETVTLSPPVFLRTTSIFHTKPLLALRRLVVAPPGAPWKDRAAAAWLGGALPVLVPTSDQVLNVQDGCSQLSLQALF